jgi:hypothetical protein
VAVTDDGCVAAAIGMAPPDQVVLPSGVADAPDRSWWLPGIGRCRLEPLPGGWLLRADVERERPPMAVVLDLVGSRRELRASGAAGSWSAPLSLRHAELLLALVQRPEGSTAAQLAEDLFGDAARTVTVRAEFSRLRRALGSLLVSQPYRLAESLPVELELPPDRRLLLPGSTAPVVERLRTASG